jgi:pimeloyl-ACP methyl ester carboxylesterase
MPKAVINGISISYKIEGNGEPLIMIMGIASTKKAWLFQTLAFKKYYKVITLDNRGCGESDKPSSPYSIKTMADDIAGLMVYLGIEKAHVLGASMGGMIAQELAINYPEKVNKLILCCTMAKRTNPGGLSAELPKKLGYMADYNYSDVLSLPEKRIILALSELAFNRKINRLILLPIMKLFIKKLDFTGLKNQIFAIWEHDTLERLKYIKASTLVITGSGDRIINPRSSDVLAERIPHSRLVKYEGGSHAFFVEMRKRFNSEIIAFLNNNHL